MEKFKFNCKSCLFYQRYDHLFMQVTQLLNELSKKSNQTQNINSHQQIYWLVGIMISCEVQTSYTFIEHELAQIGHSSYHFAIKLKESARFTHFNLQFQQI